MKFTKPNAEAPKKTKALLSAKIKFKSKDAAVPIVKLQKNTKQAANLIKQMVNDKELNIALKNEHTGGASKKSKKKKTNKPGELSPEVQMGLKLDRLIEQKIKEQNMNAKASLSPKGKNAKPFQESTNSSSSISESSPKANKKRKKGKKKGNNENKSTQSTVIQNKSNGASPEKLNSNKKQAQKRKNENVVLSSSDVTFESTNESANLVKAKPKKRKGKARQQAVSASENEDAKDEEAGDLPGESYTLNSKDVLKAVKSSIDQFKKISKSSKKLLDSEPEPMFLHFNFFYPHNKQRIIRFELCNSLVTSTSDVCLFVADIAKNNAEESKAQWEKILRDEKVTSISEVIPLRSLATDYTQFQDMRKLSQRFDFFLVDGKISHRVYKLLGSKFFHTKRKTPAPITMKKGKMAEYITKGLAKTVAQYTPAADSFSIQVGHTDMNEQDIMKNILKVWEQYPQQFGVYWENIREASIFSPQTSKLPIFISVSPPEGKPREYKNMKWSKDSDTPVKGELSTAMDKPVLVYPDGRVVIENLPLEKSAEAKAARREKNKEKKRLLKMKKQNKTEEDSDEGEEEDDEELDSDDDLGGRADMLESETDEDDEPPMKKPAGKQDVKKTVVPEKKSKGKQILAKKSGKDSDSDIADEAEASYLRDLAAEKKTKGKAQLKGKGGKQQKSNSKHSDSEDNDSDDSSHPEDDDIEDSLDDLEDFSMEEDSDSDEEEEVVKKPAGKPKGMKKGNKGNKKINGAHQQTNPKSQRQMTQKKSGAVKSPQNKKGKKKQDSSQSSSSEGTSNKKKVSVPSFQGSQANQKQKKNKNQQGVKNKQVARKLAK